MRGTTDLPLKFTVVGEETSPPALRSPLAKATLRGPDGIERVRLVVDLGEYDKATYEAPESQVALTFAGLKAAQAFFRFSRRVVAESAAAKDTIGVTIREASELLDGLYRRPRGRRRSD